MKYWLKKFWKNFWEKIGTISPCIKRGYIYYYMKKIIKLTESDLTHIVKQVMNESIVDKHFFTRRGIDYRTMFDGFMEKHNPCKYVKLSTYFNKVYENFILHLFLTNEIIRNEIENEHETSSTTTESKIRSFIVDEYADLVYTYYKIKCKRSPK